MIECGLMMTTMVIMTVVIMKSGLETAEEVREKEGASQGITEEAARVDLSLIENGRLMRYHHGLPMMTMAM